MPIFDNNKNSESTIYDNDSRINNPYYDQNNQISQPTSGSNLNLNTPNYPSQNSNSSFLNNNFNQNKKPLKPNFTKKELAAVEMPKQIAKEIKLEKLRIVSILSFAIVLLSVSIFFICVYFFAPIVDNQKLKIPTEYIPHPAYMFILGIIGLSLLTLGLIDYSHLRIDVRGYKGDLIMGIEKIPYFIIRNYKSLIARPIYMNWAAFSTYIIGGIIVGIFYIIKAASHGDKPMKTEIIITLSILGVMLFVHIASLIFTRSRKGSINSYYGYEIVPFEQVKDLRKRANRTCLIIFFIFIAIILCVVVIPYIIVRRNKGKSVIPFI